VTVGSSFPVGEII
jgi:hypothetical protein